MRLRRVRPGRELRCDAGGTERVLCPRCGAPWLVRTAGSADAGTCGHLRFTWYVGVYGGVAECTAGWEAARFERDFTARYRRLTRSEGDHAGPPAMFDTAVMKAILRGLAHPDIAEVWYHQFVESDEHVCADAAIFWGVGTKPLPEPGVTPFPATRE